MKAHNKAVEVGAANTRRPLNGSVRFQINGLLPKPESDHNLNFC